MQNLIFFFGEKIKIKSSIFHQKNVRKKISSQNQKLVDDANLWPNA